MSKKNWIMIKRGLSEDAAHREAMGVKIWLFMHIIDRVDWSTGRVYDWRDKDEAEDMQMSWRTLQGQRQELEALGYITCIQKQDGQEIIIHEWINPRDYGGGVLNSRKEGTENSVPHSNEGTPQGTPEGTRKGVRKPRTPTSNSGDHGSGNQQAGAKQPRPADPLFDAIALATCADPATAGPSIGKIESSLKKAEPPYTPDEVGRFVTWWWSDPWRKKKGEPPSLWQLQEKIGIVRSSNGNGNGNGHHDKPFMTPAEIERARADGWEIG